MKMKHFNLLTLLILGGCSLNAVDEEKNINTNISTPLVETAETISMPLKTLDEKIGDRK